MDWAYQIAVRTAPAIASGLLALGVNGAHVEVIALGLSVGAVSCAELVIKWMNKNKGAK